MFKFCKMSSTIQGQLLARIPRDSICYMVVCIVLIYLMVEAIVSSKYMRKSVEVDECRPTRKTRSWSQEAFTMSSQQKEPKICGSVVGHLPETYGIDISKLPRDEGRPWNQMKWMGKPARCRVKGQLIESLDDIYNFRRGWALKYVKDVEDKHHLLPWLLGNRVDLNLSKRRVYLDLGANSFKSSIQWFMQMYPCDFTEVHAFESNPNVFEFPKDEFDEDSNFKVRKNKNAIAVIKTPEIPKWMIKRMHIYNSRVSDFDDESTNIVNITRFIKETLKLKATDTVVVKMDIEGNEWSILEKWLEDSDMVDIIDELFVEVHYYHPSVRWDNKEHTRDQASHLFASLRAKGFYVHPWP